MRIHQHLRGRRFEGNLLTSSTIAWERGVSIHGLGLKLVQNQRYHDSRTPEYFL